MTVEAVFPKIREIVADVLVIEPEDVSLNSQLISELGAESIDFLDLVFQLEKEFKIKIPRGQLEKAARGALSDEEFEQNGVVTEKGMMRLQQYFAEVPAQRFSKPIKVNEIPSLFTVETFCKLVVKSQAELTIKSADEITA